ncbi:MAG: hypothetical protein ABIJ27_02260 [Candidatus Omnitrophota bacterium]
MMIDREILLRASKEYDSDKYSEELYAHCLDVLNNAHSVDNSLVESVINLLYWKLGKIKKRRTPKGKEISVSGLNSRYFLAGTTKSNLDAISNATKSEILEQGIKFKNNTIEYEEFKGYAERITRSSIVLPAYFVHIWRPDKYPIFDKNVWKKYRAEMGM